MRLRVVTFVVLCTSATAAMWACSLNPQPFPPDGYDAAADNVLTTSPDAAGGMDSSSADSGPLSDDATTDATAKDATDDATDAAGDAADDARDDDDAAGDAGEDG